MNAVPRRIQAKRGIGDHLPDSEQSYQAVPWPNGCNETVPKALRYLAEHDRPCGGQQSFNAEHLYQLASEIERMSKAQLYRKVIGYAPTAAPRTKPQAARDPMMAAVASLAAAISLLERTPKANKAAPSDKMFNQMLDDYRRALANARDALRSQAESAQKGSK
jgi:hypothetical protein